MCLNRSAEAESEVFRAAYGYRVLEVGDEVPFAGIFASVVKAEQLRCGGYIAATMVHGE